VGAIQDASRIPGLPEGAGGGVPADAGPPEDAGLPEDVADAAAWPELDEL